MKKQQHIFKAFLLFCLIASSHNAVANGIEETIITKQSYAVNKDIKLEVFNKYGTVHISTWQKDSLVIKATQKLKANDKKQLDRLKEAMTFNITKTQYIVLVKSQVNDPTLNLLRMLPIELSAPTVSEVDIQISMPEYLNLGLEHKYGDVFIETITGDAYINISHGQFKAHNFYGTLKLELNYCNSTINHIENGNITTRFGDLNIDSANELVLESRSTDVIIKKCNDLNIDGKNDDIIVQSCNNLQIQAYFSKARFEMVRGNVFTQTSYGNLSFHFPKGYEKDIKIKSNYTDLELSFVNSGYYPIEILHQKSRIMYPSTNTHLKEDKVSGKDVIYKTTGTLGTGKLLNGGLNLEMFSGELKLLIK